MTKILNFLLVIVLLGLSLNFLPIQTEADVVSYRIVSARFGANMRDSKCNKVDTVGFGTLLTVEAGAAIDCQIKGKTVKMVNVSQTFGDDSRAFYIGESSTKSLLSANLDLSDKTSLTVNSPSRANLRSKDCKRALTVNNGTTLDLPQGQGGSLQICRVGTAFYDMVNVLYKGNDYQIATVLVKV